MKKYIIGVAIFALLAVPFLSSADVMSDLQAQLDALLKQITELQAQLNVAQGGSTTVSTTGTTVTVSPITALSPSIPVACTIFKYNLYMGLSDKSTVGEVTKLQRFLAEDSSVYPEGLITGFFGPMTERAVQKWQAKNGVVSSGSPDTTGYGVVGPKTRTKMGSVCGIAILPIQPPPGNQPPVINGVSGPTALNVNQTGTWEVKASDPEGGQLTYSVRWGDEVVGIAESQTRQLTYSQTVRFTHSYSRSGVYYPTFTVTDNQGKSAVTSISVNIGDVQVKTGNVKVVVRDSTGLVSNVGVTVYKGTLFVTKNTGSTGEPVLFDNLPVGSYTVVTNADGYYLSPAQTINIQANVTGNLSFYLTKVPTGQPLITILSPNGGEVLKIGETRTISWRVKDFPSNGKINISLDGEGESRLLRSFDGFAESVNWVVPSDVTPGNYVINAEISLDIGAVASDNSDTTFSIVSVSAGTPSITVLSPNGGEVWQRGSKETISYTFSGLSANQRIDLTLFRAGDLTTGLGLKTIYTNDILGTNYDSKEIVYINETVPLTAPGSFVIKISVSDFNGYAVTSDKSNAPFSIVQAGTPSITVLSPNGGEVWEIGKSYYIRWESAGLDEVNIKLLSQHINDPSTYRASKIASNVKASNGSYLWHVPKEMECLSLPCLSLSEYPAHLIEVVDSRYGRDSTVLRVISDESNAPFSIVSTISVNDTDIELRSISKGDFHTYGFNANVCMHGSKSINDLKNEIPQLVLLGLPAAYVVYDANGIKHQGDAGVSGSIEYLKNGQCATYGWTIQASEQTAYNQTKKVELILDPNNIIKETNENNNQASYSTVADTLTCAELEVSQKYYFDVCSNGFDNVCLNKFTGAFQACTLNTRNDCTVNNMNADSNMLCPASQPSITVLSPNGGEVWGIGETRTISWDAAVNLYRFNIYLLDENFNSKVIAENVGGSGSPLTISWSTSSTLPGKYYIEIEGFDSSGNNVLDRSDAPFNIVSVQSSILSPTTQTANTLNSISGVLEELSNLLKNWR